MHKKVASAAWSQVLGRGRELHVCMLNRKQWKTTHMTMSYSTGKILKQLNAQRQKPHKETRKQWHNRLGCLFMIFFGEKNRMTDQHLIFDNLNNALDIYTELSMYSPVIIKCKRFTVLTLLGWCLHQIYNHIRFTLPIYVVCTYIYIIYTYTWVFFNKLQLLIEFWSTYGYFFLLLIFGFVFDIVGWLDF